jgi:hypothetical protein
VTLQVIVEGDGEVDAVRLLLRRLQDAAQAYPLQFGRPHKRPKSGLLRQDSLQHAVRAVMGEEHCDGILILFDGEDECTEELRRERGPLGPLMEKWAREAARGVPCAVVIAYREYESWFLASIESLRGIAGIRDDAPQPDEPEFHRGAKEALEGLMLPNKKYTETEMQPRLTAHFDMAAAYRRSRSFQRMVRAFAILAQGCGITLDPWPPADWTEAPDTP